MKEIEAAVAIILAQEGTKQEILIIHRAEIPNDPWSGHMGLPGGRCEPCDTSLLDTAIRETREETGIRLDPRKLSRVLDDIKPRHRSIPKVMIRPHVFHLKKRPLVTPGSEVAEYFWIGIKELGQSARSARVPERRFPVDAYMLGPHIIWGITQRILKAFLSTSSAGAGSQEGA